MTTEKHWRNGTLVLFCVLALLAMPVPAQTLQSEHEKSNYAQYTSYENMIQYLEKVRGLSQEMVLGAYGETLQGRPIPYAVLSRPPISQPWEAAASGKPIVVFAANVHGGEKTLRESLLIMMRESVTPGTAMYGMLDKIVLVVVPSINPDGSENTPRAIRGNLRNIDMNRDYIKLEQPELAAYVKNILHVWHPHVVVDGHNGCAFPYNVCYQGPSMASGDPRLTEICDKEIFPLINKRMGESKYRSWYYSGGDQKAWRTGGYDARIGRNYSGLMNSIGILFESPGGQPGEMATRSGMVAYQTVAEFASANSARVRELVSSARQETVAAGKNATGEVVVQMKYDPEDYKVSYLIGAPAAGTGGAAAGAGVGRAAAAGAGAGRAVGGGAGAGRAAGTGGAAGAGRAAGGGAVGAGAAAGAPGGRGWDRPIVEVKDAQLIKKPVPTKTRPRPYAYILEPRSVEAVRMLQRHNIHIEVLTEAAELEVAYYRIDREVKYSHEYDHPASANVQVVDTASKKMTFPKGSFLILTGQPLGRVVTHMMEPETNDNVVKWNTMDFALPVNPVRTQPADEEERRAQPNPSQPAREPVEFPIYKLMKPQALPTQVLAKH
jgi:hypothetical protein